MFDNVRRPDLFHRRINRTSPQLPLIECPRRPDDACRNIHVVDIAFVGPVFGDHRPDHYALSQLAQCSARQATRPRSSQITNILNGASTRYRSRGLRASWLGAAVCSR